MDKAEIVAPRARKMKKIVLFFQSGFMILAPSGPHPRVSDLRCPGNLLDTLDINCFGIIYKTF